MHQNIKKKTIINGGYMEQNNQKLINELLTKIKKEVNDKINLEPVQTAKTDLVMCDLLNDLLENFQTLSKKDFSSSLVYDVISSKEIFTKQAVINRLTLLYSAHYFNNISLLNKMRDYEVSLTGFNHQPILSLFDPEIVSRFEEQEYLEITKKYSFLFEEFYSSIKDLNPQEQEPYLKRFTYIIKNINLDITPLDYSLNGIVNNWGLYRLFSKKNLDTFDDVTYLVASLAQLKKFDRIGTHFDIVTETNETKRHLNFLIQTIDFREEYVDYGLMFKLFTTEELLDLPFGFETSYYFSLFKDEPKLLDKAYQLWKIKPSIQYYIGKQINLFKFIEAVDNDVIIAMIDNQIDLDTKLENLEPIIKTYQRKNKVKKTLRKK